MPKINRPEIFRKAWREYRFQMKWRDDQPFDRLLFASCLRDQWHYARMDRAEAIERAIEAARLASASPAERRVAEIRAELQDMEFGDFIPWQRRSDLAAELARLAA
jgi:hypothetical protein